MRRRPCGRQCGGRWVSKRNSVRVNVRVKWIAALAALCLVGAACSGDDSEGAKEAPRKVENTTAGADPATGSCRPEGDEKPAQAVLRCGEDAVASVETAWASGTGVAVEVDRRRYILTNQHVVDPFDAVLRKRRARQVFQDLIQRRIAHSIAQDELQRLTQRRTGGWLKP